ncbi:MAG TPA: ADP-forming succinate--CoA ligase subunit beta [Rectinemataceae bacterium]|nr:ADP-forming succinate--CoA ligase subunit beta [Rectinemataceae bacterium]
MKIHEYQAKELFAKYGVPVPKGEAAFDVESAVQVAAGLGSWPVVVKAQIHAGGRGKGGGVKLAKNIAEAREHAKSILGMTLVTRQTGPKGRLVRRLLVEEGCRIAKELYLGILPDRETGMHLVMASAAGGMEIEEVAETSPERIVRVYVDPLAGLLDYQAREVAEGLGIPKAASKQFLGMLKNLFRLYLDYDASMVEVNPLVLTEDDKVLCLDAKVDVDSNALYRHPDILACRDTDEEDPHEIEAFKYGLAYIKLEGGNVGNMVNGAGLAMATMDAIKAAGAAPANFLDVGGGASAEKIANAFRILLSDPNIKGILINIFGGILRCDTLANGVLAAARETKLSVPLVVRMEGTNVEEGRRILRESGLPMITADSLTDAAEKIAAAVK